MQGNPNDYLRTIKIPKYFRVRIAEEAREKLWVPVQRSEQVTNLGSA